MKVVVSHYTNAQDVARVGLNMLAEDFIAFAESLPARSPARKALEQGLEAERKRKAAKQAKDQAEKPARKARTSRTKRASA